MVLLCSDKEAQDILTEVCEVQKRGRTVPLCCYNSYTSVYHTAIDSIIQPALWSKVFETIVNVEAARFWGIYNDSGKLYVVGSNRIHIFDSLPIGFVSPVKTLSTGIIDTFTQIV